MALSNHPFYLACLNGDSETLATLLSTSFSTDDLNYGLQGACEGGHRDFAYLMITKGARIWNFSLYYAHKDGRRAIVDFLIEKGSFNIWNCRFDVECFINHRALVALMVEKDVISLAQIVSYFSCDKRCIPHIVLRLGKQKRKNLTNTLRMEQGLYEYYSMMTYLANRHLIRYASSQPFQTKKRILYGVLQQFVCSDIVIWSCCFVGRFVSLTCF